MLIELAIVYLVEMMVMKTTEKEKKKKKKKMELVGQSLSSSFLQKEAMPFERMSFGYDVIKNLHPLDEWLYQYCEE